MTSALILLYDEANTRGSYDQRPQSLRTSKAVITAHAFILPFKREETL